jgi:hypothetical protein
MQSGYGNRAVTGMVQALQRQPAGTLAEPAPLPPIADNLRRFRTGFPRLQALAGTAAPATSPEDIAPAVAWLSEVVETLRIVEPIADSSGLFFESFAVEGHDAEYSRAAAEIKPQIAATLAAVAPIARATGEGLRDAVMEAVNSASVTEADRTSDPAIVPLDQATAWREQASALARLASPVDLGGAGLREAAGACEDAALAMLQARSVLSARATWRSGAAVESAGSAVNAPGRARNEVDDIFADAGWSGRQSLDGSAVADWCGMFVAASMFRGAGLDKDMRTAFAHTDNVHDFFTYDPSPTNRGRTPASIWADGEWWGVREYHEQRALPRTWAQGDAIDEADIRPGDVALIRHWGTPGPKGIANHIVMVESYDAGTGRLVTIEGNVGDGIRADASGAAKRTASGELADDAAAEDSSVVHVRNLGDATTTTPPKRVRGTGTPYEERGRQTIFGIGRPSLVDFEDHEYGLLPVPGKYRYFTPAEIRAKGLGKQMLQPAGRTESPAGGPYHQRVD